MKKEYIRPSIKEIECYVNSVMMAVSVNTGVGNTPSYPNANERRDAWDDPWS